MPEALRLFIICEGMNFAQLPLDGGLYDQHPKLLDCWGTIWGMKADHEQRETARREAEQSRGQAQQPQRAGRARRR